MQKAKTNFSPLEHAYAKQFGQYPDYHFTRLRQKYNCETTSQIIQRNMDFIYQQEKEKAGYIKDGLYAVTNNDQIPF